MQTWKNNDVPERWQSSPISINREMPSWKYVLMTDEDNRLFVKKHFPDFLEIYDKFPYNIQRADAIRYMWLYVHGGIYIDLDYEMLKPLDNLFETDGNLYFVYSKNIGNYITNSIMASKPGCDFWLEVIAEMSKASQRWYPGKHLQVMNTTGPMMLTHVIRRTKYVYTILPTVSTIPCSVCDFPCKAQDTYLNILEGSSWVGWDSHIYTFFLCRWKQLLWILGIAFIIAILIIIIIKIYQRLQ